nr:hypothetical protein CFP56_19455 [Quercus suber]
MSRLHPLRNTFILGILLLLFLVTSFENPRVVLLWRRLSHKPTPLLRPYRAPLVNCELPDLIPDSYFIFLHHGCSLENHKRTIGYQIDLDSKIQYSFPETRHYGHYYGAYDLDDAALDAIRADIAVDMIECNRELHVDLEVEDVVLMPDDYLLTKSIPYGAQRTYSLPPI